jgi:hypothetical protein
MPTIRVMRRALAATGCLLLVYGALATAAGRADAQTEEVLAGFQLEAVSDALAINYNQPSLGIPATPTGEIDIVHTNAKLQNGPSSYGLASILWPGQVAANIGSAFPGVPSYPVRAESAFPAGPGEATFPEGGGGSSLMRSEAGEAGSEAFATIASIGVSGLFDAGSQSSSTKTSVTSSVALSEASATATGLSLGGGAITIESVSTRITAQSDGKAGKVGGQTSVVGMEIAGTPVRIDGNGIHVQGESTDPGAAILKQTLNGVLNQLGISFALSDAIDLIEGPKATRSLGGLIITFEPSFLASGFEMLPDELKQQIRANFPAAATEFDQTIRLVVAGAAVSAAAAPGFGLAPAPDVPSLPTGGGATSGGNGGESGPNDGATTGTPVSGDVGTGALSSGGAAPVSFPEPFGGLAIWLGIGALLIAAASSRPLTWAADQVFARRAATGCPNAQGVRE